MFGRDAGGTLGSPRYRRVAAAGRLLAIGSRRRWSEASSPTTGVERVDQLTASRHDRLRRRRAIVDLIQRQLARRHAERDERLRRLSDGSVPTSTAPSATQRRPERRGVAVEHLDDPAPGAHLVGRVAEREWPRLSPRFLARGAGGDTTYDRLTSPPPQVAHARRRRGCRRSMTSHDDPAGERSAGAPRVQPAVDRRDDIGARGATPGTRSRGSALRPRRPSTRRRRRGSAAAAARRRRRAINRGDIRTERGGRPFDHASCASASATSNAPSAREPIAAGFADLGGGNARVGGRARAPRRARRRRPRARRATSTPRSTTSAGVSAARAPGRGRDRRRSRCRRRTPSRRARPRARRRRSRARRASRPAVTRSTTSSCSARAASRSARGGRPSRVTVDAPRPTRDPPSSARGRAEHDDAVARRRARGVGGRVRRSSMRPSTATTGVGSMSAPLRLVVEAHVAADDRQPERLARLGDALDDLGERPHHLGMLGVAEVEAVDERERRARPRTRHCARLRSRRAGRRCADRAGRTGPCRRSRAPAPSSCPSRAAPPRRRPARRRC